MRSVYDSDSDTFYLRFAETPTAESEEVADGVILDFDADGKIVAIELLDASKHLSAGSLSNVP